jgi:hypothetical protein
MPNKRLLVAGLGLVAVVACGKTKHRAVPPPPPVVAITTIRAVAGTTLASDCGGSCCLEVGTDANATVVVSVDPTQLNFLLRPPGMCGKNTQCGYLVLELDPSGTGPLRAVPGITTDVSLPVAGLTGPHRVYVELRHEDDRAVLDATGQPVHAELDVVLSPPGGCSATPDAGADAGDGSLADSGEDSMADAGAEGDGAGELDASEDAGEDAEEAAPDAESAEAAGEDATADPEATGG